MSPLETTTFRVGLPAMLAIALVAAPASAVEPTKDDCIDAHRSAQALRRAGKLRAARKELLLCGSASCPAILRDECSERLEALERVQPTIVFEAKSPAGKDVRDVAVELDGAPWVGKLDGTAVPVDPGEHTFVFVSTSAPPVTERFTIHENEQSRREMIVIGLPAAPPPNLAIRAAAGDQIALDGRDVGVASWSGRVAPGFHDVKVSHPGKRPFHTDVEVAPNALREVDAALVNEPKGIVPPWVWIAGAGLLIAAGVGAAFLLRDPEPSAPPPAGGLGTIVLSFGRGSR